MMICDLCGKPMPCLQKEIDGTEYDLCSDCWGSLALKLKGKGRPKNRETVLLPTRPIEKRVDEEEKPLPGEPPKIWGASHHAL